MCSTFLSLQDVGRALEYENHVFRDFHAEEMILVLQKLARNDENGIKIMKKMDDYKIFQLIFDKGLCTAAYFISNDV